MRRTITVDTDGNSVTCSVCGSTHRWYAGKGSEAAMAHADKHAAEPDYPTVYVTKYSTDELATVSLAPEND